MPLLKMSAATEMNDADEIIIGQGGRKRRLTRSSLLGSLESRMQSIENAPNNSALADRIGSLEEWRATKSAAITDVNTSNMSVEVLGVSVGRASAMNEVGAKVNAILSALRQREIIVA